MSVQVETVGYKFRVSQGQNVFDVISTTELGITKSNEIIRTFFDNFKVLKVEKVVKPEEIAIDEDKTRNIERNEAAKVGGGSGSVVKPARKQRETTKDLWGNLRELLSDEFTRTEYVNALRDAGYEYTKGSWSTLPSAQLKNIAKLGKIEIIEGSSPVKYRKIKVPHSFRSDQDAEKNMKRLRAGERVLLETMK
jgi:hypothetical protein